MMNDHQQLLWLLLPATVLNGLREAASQPMGVWDYLANGGIITVAVILWVALKR